MYDIVQCKHPKTHGMTPTEVFHGIQKVIDAQLSLEVSGDSRKQLADFIKLSQEQQD